jgi:ABC-2 type transport system permease protein
MSTLTLRQRPTVFGDDIRRFWSLTWTLAFTEFRLRFYGSMLGVVWSVARPFLFFGVIYLVFANVANFDDKVKQYPVVVLFGMVLFGYFGETTGGCMMSLLNRENMLRKIRFPRMVIPLSVAVTALLNLGMTLVPVFGFAIVAGVDPTWRWIELIPLLLLLIALSVGIGMLLAALYPRFRDIAPIWDVISQILFYATPILYVVSMLPDNWREPYMLNPLAAILTQFRHAMIDPTAPSAATEAGSAWVLLLPIALVIGVFLFGLWVFNREAPKVAERL